MAALPPLPSDFIGPPAPNQTRRSSSMLGASLPSLTGGSAGGATSGGYTAFGDVSNRINTVSGGNPMWFWLFMAGVVGAGIWLIRKK